MTIEYDCDKPKNIDFEIYSIEVKERKTKNMEEKDIFTDSKVRYERLKELSTKLKETIIETYPQFAERDIKFLTKMLGNELEYLFSEMRVY